MVQKLPKKLRALANEFQLIPLHRWDAKKSVKTREGKTKSIELGKAPSITNWIKKELPQSAEVAIKCIKGGTNIGVRLAKDDLVIDVDPRNYPDGRDSLEELRSALNLKLDNFPRVRTGAGGLHIFMKKPADRHIKGAIPDYPGLEFKSYGQQVVAVGSKHPNGQTYTWENDDLALGIPDAPARLLNLIERAGKGSVSTECVILEPEECAIALEAIGQIDEYEDWIKCLMAIHSVSNGEALEQAQDWSYPGDEEIVATKWTSFDAEGNNSGKVGFGTLRFLCKENNGDIETLDRMLVPDPKEDFPDDIEDLLQQANLPKIRSIIEKNLAVKNGVAPNSYVNALRAVYQTGLDPRFDELKQKIILSKPLPGNHKDYGRIYNDNLLSMIRLYITEMFEKVSYEPSLDNVDEALRVLAFGRKFNPIHDYLDSLKWDGESRVENLFVQGFNCVDDAYSRGVSKAFMIGSIKRAREPGCKFDTMPVIKGPQGSLKSTGLKELFSAEWFSDAELGKLDNKDAPMLLDGIWLHEFAELSSVKASEVDTLKAFMSRAIDRYRSPYGKIVDDHPRRIVFAGTVNEGGYLNDSSGGRRFWPLEMAERSRVDVEWIKQNRDQLWAEADKLYESIPGGEILPEDLWGDASMRQSDETIEDPWVDAIKDILQQRKKNWNDYLEKKGDWSEDAEILVGAKLEKYTAEIPPKPDKVHTQELLGYLLGEGTWRQAHKGHSSRIRKIMESKNFGWKHAKAIRYGGKNLAGYTAPFDPLEL